MSKLTPVIHVETEGLAVDNAQIVHEAGAHGCFLIDHHCDSYNLVDCYNAVRNAFPDMWIGLNFLGCEAENLYVHLPEDAQAVWLDNIKEDETFWACCPSTMLVFGGVAFKYQKKVTDVGLAAYKALNHCDVVTTSGDATGVAPVLQKIQAMKEAIGDKPLAIASGMTPDNVLPFVPYVDYFLVATGISSSFNQLDPEKVKKMVALVQTSAAETSQSTAQPT